MTTTDRMLDCKAAFDEAQDDGNDLQPCPRCGLYTDSVIRRHRHTAYVEDEMNYVTCCWECFDIEEDYWDEQWNDYYGGLM